MRVLPRIKDIGYFNSSLICVDPVNDLVIFEYEVPEIFFSPFKKNFLLSYFRSFFQVNSSINNSINYILCYF